DITERKEAEERLRRSLAEKEVLLREVHHRVKNNLNIISSLLNLQAGAIQNPQQALEGFQHSRERIMAMALVHEELYKSRDYASVDMGQYLADLVRNLSLGYGVENRIRIEASAIGVDLNVTSSIPCGLILNELIANAIKYAFPAGEQGEIRISLSKTGTGLVHMELSDDGVGLPRPFEELCDSEGASLGLVLVRLLVDQLEGTIEATVGQGTTYRIDFPEAV
ncbi:MAG: sensor histidine kinase, partial [Spirochaetales bacterium]|nr:sensor histidine kinase [Spirochaetales bacterium]